MKNLTSISEHSDYLEKTFTFDTIKWDLHLKRLEFGKQPLSIWMFVPCDEDGNVLDAEPCSLGMFAKGNPFFDVYLESKNKWDKAIERCIFNGCEFDNIDIIINSSIRLNTLDNFKHLTIESLVYARPELTPTALKTLGL